MMSTCKWQQFCRRLALWTTICLSVSGCSGGDEDYGPDEPEKNEPDPIGNERPLPTPTALKCDKGTYLTYSNFGSGFLGNYCLDCHTSTLPEANRNGSPLEVDFETLYLVQIWRDKILLKAAGEAPTMPPNQNVPVQDRKDFSEWLNCGAPQ